VSTANRDEGVEKKVSRLCVLGGKKSLCVTSIFQPTNAHIISHKTL